MTPLQVKRRAVKIAKSHARDLEKLAEAEKRSKKLTRDQKDVATHQLYSMAQEAYCVADEIVRMEIE